MNRMSRSSGWAVVAVIVALAACYRGATERNFDSNYDQVRIEGKTLVAAATGAPFSGTVIAKDADVAEIGQMVFGGTELEGVARIDPAGLILVLSVKDGVPWGTASVHADLRAEKLSPEITSRLAQLELAVAKTLAPRIEVARAEFAAGRLEGTATLLAPAGRSRTTKMAEVAFASNRPSGVATEYFPGSDRLRRELRFAGGKIHGEMIEYYADGSVRLKGRFEGGEPAGTHESWFPTGKLQSRVVYDPAGATIEQWYSNGELALRSGPAVSVENPPHGEIIEYHRSGAVRSRTRYERGIPHGPYEVFYGSGDRWEIGQYDQGTRTGPHKKWYGNGTLALDATWKSGELHGRYQRWYASKKPWELATYDGGKKTGRYQKWWKNGARAHDYTYKDGKLDGPYRTWYDSGAKWAVGEYADGKPVGTMKRWFPDGRLGYEMHHANGKPHGPYRRWWANGTVRLDAAYVDGRLHGELSNWLEDGSVYELARYDKGEKLESTLATTP